VASRFSKSLEIIGNGTDQSATHDFLLTFHINRGPLMYRFCRETAISV